jgi:CO/xanthine dehydrogenase Mo-binding subunit
VGAQRVRALRNDLAERTFRPGYLRSVGAGWTNWALESFMDEAAHAAGIDAVEFRLRMLDAAGRNAGSSPSSVGGAHRQAAVLARAAQKAGWGKPTPRDVGLGIATTFGQERATPTWLACAARVAVDRSNGHVTVEKLTIVIDAGTIIHPNSAEAQVEGALLWGLGMALHEGSEFIDGQPKDTNLDTYRVLRMADVPEIEVEFIPARKPRSDSENRRLPGLRRRSGMRSSPPAGRAFVTFQSGRQPYWKRSRTARERAKHRTNNWDAI